MNRYRVILFAVFLSLLVIILPLAITLYLSWDRALKMEEQHLVEYTRRVSDRIQITIDEAKEALEKMHSAGKIMPCSDKHIHLMRELTLLTRSVEKIGYFENGFLKCSSWGLEKEKVGQFNVDFTLDKKVSLSLSAKSTISPSANFIAVIEEPYDIYIDPLRFVDIIVESDIQLSIITKSGEIITSSHDPDPLLIKKFFNKKKNLDIINDKIVYYIPKPNIGLIAIEPVSYVKKQFYSTMWVFLPFGIVTSLFMIMLIIYYSIKQLSFVGELKSAVKNKQFVVYYQPIIEPKINKCIGAEALVRWRQPDGELIRPDLFIPLAEENNLISEITDQVIDGVISDLRDLLIKDPSLHISINVNANDIQSGRILEVLESKLANTGIQRNQIWIEVTERVFLELSSAIKTLNKARALGYLIVIDDFGTGYSNLAFLQKFQLDILKIDKSFIDTITTDSVTSSVTAHIIDIANELHLKIVAEGVETKGQVEYLQEKDVSYIQGYYFSKPIAAEAFKAFYGKFKTKDDL